MQRKKFFRHVSMMLIAIMLFGLIATPTSSMAHGNAKNTEPSSTDFSKIQAELLEEYEEEEFARYLVLLHDQVDTEKVMLEAQQKASKQSLSSEDSKTMQQKAVVSSLMEKAEQTQDNLANYLEKQHKAKTVKEYQNFFIINGFAVIGTKETVEEIASFPEVKSILLEGKQYLTPIKEGDEMITVSSETSDDEIEWHIDRIGAPDAWDRGITGEGTVIGSIDSGAFVDHPALVENYRGYDPDNPDELDHEFNWFDPAGNIGSPVDSDGHGTHTLGTMVGQEADGSNKIGVAPGAKWITARAFAYDQAYDSDIIEAAEWMLAPTDNNGVPHPEMAPDVVSNSWGGNPIINDWFRPIVQAWRAAGIVPVFSIGNAGLFNSATPGSASAPGNYPESIGVGASDENDDLASFSLRGPTEDGTMKPDLIAPGVNIRSSYPGETWDTYDYGTANGTSMAAPQVAATALLMLQADSSLTVEQIEQTLKLTATTKTDDEYPESPNNGYGHGMLNADLAVQMIEDRMGTIHGTVVASGEDNEAPTFVHDAREMVFTNQEQHFSVQAGDNISVNDVTLHVEYDNGTEKTYKAERTDGDHLDGTYEVYIPGEDIVGESLEYWWSIKDFQGQETTSERYQVDVLEGVQAGYVEDFETYPDGWYSFGMFDTWEWGVPEFGPDGAASGEKVMGTNLRGNYSMDSDMTLVMPPVLVEEGLQLRFNQWYSLSWFGWDKGFVYVSTDGGENWDEIYNITEENESWHEVGINLSDYAGQKVLIGFNLTSLDNEFPGWYIDDIQLVNNSSESTIENGTGETTTLPEPSNTSYPMITKEMKKQTETRENLLPVNAKIKVVETGWETSSSSQSGEFSIYHPAGDYTLEISAYGHETYTENITLQEAGVVTPSIELTPLPRQILSGQIVNTAGEVIPNATVNLLEDENVNPVSSDASGNYSLAALTGTYTLKVQAPGYYGLTKEITVVEGEDLNLNIHLADFNSTDQSEIYYDNGDWSKNFVFGKKDSGFAVKMSLEEGKEAALLTGAKLQFWAGHVPVPGGEDIHISVYDATGVDGSPGNKIIGPIKATATRDLNQWTEVDLSEHGIVVEDDFYILYQQTDDYPYVPGFVADGDSSNYAGRSWDYFGGEWYQADDSLGNYMIRAVVDYGEKGEIPEVETPVITAPESGLETNEPTITVEGTASSFTTTQILRNGEAVGMTSMNENGQFTIDVDLLEGENELQAVSLYNGTVVEESESILVTLSYEQVERLSGELRYDTAIEVSQAGWDAADTVVLARGTEYSDALAGVPLAHQLDAPILLTRSNELYGATLEEIERLGASEVVILGGTGAISEEVETELIATGLDVRRLDGETRFETAALIAAEVAPNGTEQVAVVSGRDFPDAMSVASHAAKQGMPILLTREDSLPEATDEALDDLGVEETIVVGGYEVIHKDVFDQLPNGERLRGEDRYQTNIAVNEYFNVHNKHLYVATGRQYADALTGAVLAAKNDSSIVLVGAEVHQETKDFITNNETMRLTIFGGTVAVSEEIVDTLTKLLP